jgi:hypothetical protein
MMKTGLVNMGIGAVIAIVGIVVTVASYAAVSHGGGTYVVAWGAVAIGAWRFLLGLFQVLRSAFSERPAASSMESPSSLATGGLATAGGPLTTGSIISMPDELPVEARVIGVLLILQALVRLGFLINLLVHTPIEYLGYFRILIMSVILPGVFGVGGLIAGGLVLSRSASARGFGLAFCILGLLYQLYGASSLLVAAMSSASIQLSPLTWILIPSYIVIYIVGILVFSLSPYYRAQS